MREVQAQALAHDWDNQPQCISREESFYGNLSELNDCSVLMICNDWYLCLFYVSIFCSFIPSLDICLPGSSHGPICFSI